MTKQELLQWYALNEQIVNGWHMSEADYRELIRLNHLVMSIVHKIHNDNMMGGKK